MRYLEVAHSIEPLKITPPLRILGMIASPADQVELDVAEEQRRLGVALRPLQEQGLVQLNWVPGRTRRALQREMLGGPWHIFHFIGHAAFDEQSAEGLIALETEERKTHLVKASDFRALLADQKSLRLVLMNACQGASGNQQDLFASSAAMLVQRGIPAVLAMQADITDQAAIEFTRSFYEYLGQGLAVDAAVAEARKAMRGELARTLEWGTPVLYMRAPDGILFDLPPSRPPVPGPVLPDGGLLGPTKHCPRCNDLLPASARFCGRCRYQYPGPAEPQSRGESPPPAPATKRTPLLKNKLLLAVVAIVLVAALVGSGGVLWSRLQPTRSTTGATTPPAATGTSTTSAATPITENRSIPCAGSACKVMLVLDTAVIAPSQRNMRWTFTLSSGPGCSDGDLELSLEDPSEAQYQAGVQQGSGTWSIAPGQSFDVVALFALLPTPGVTYQLFAGVAGFCHTNYQTESFTF